MLGDKEARKFMNVTKTDPTADCFTDHKLATLHLQHYMQMLYCGQEEEEREKTTIKARYHNKC